MKVQVLLGKMHNGIASRTIPTPRNIVGNLTGRNEGPATAYAHLKLLAQTHPNSRKLQNLYSAISNHSYTGTAEDLKKDLDEAQKEMYQDFKNRTTQDDLNRVAEQTAHNERAYENMAWIPNAFGTVGNMIPSMLVGGAAGGIAELAGGGSMAAAGTAANTLQRVGSLGTLGLGAGGSAMDEAIRNGATYNQGMAYGALKGATEAGTEVLGGETVNKAFGQVGESVLGKVFGKAIGKLNIESAIGKKLAKIGTDIAGEMTEEMIAEAVDPLWRQLTYDNGAIKDYGTLEQWKNVFKAGLEAIPSTLIMQGGNVVLNKTSQLENGIIKSIQASDNLSPKSKQALIQQVQEASKQMVQEINAQAQNNQIARDAEALNLQPAQNNAQTTSQNLTIANQVAELNKQGFNIPKTTADILQTIQDQRGVTINFDANIKGNGTYNEATRTITLNPNSKRAIEFTTVHELAHDLKAGNMEDYTSLQNTVLDYARKNPNFLNAIESLDKTYKDEIGKGNYNISDEATNDILAEAIGNQEFLNSLAQEKPNLFERIYNWFKNVLFDGNKSGLTLDQRRTLNKMQQGFRNAYQKAFSGTQQNGVQNSFDENNIPNDISIKDSQGREIDHNIHTYSTDAYSGQVNMIKEFQDEDGNTVASLDYSYYDGDIYINMIETQPEYKRKGLATRLMKDLRQEAQEEGATIHYGYSTPDGTKFMQALDKGNTQYSLSEAPTQDNQGRQLSEGQQSYFRDSKVRDENGNLLVVYHGTPVKEHFTVFDKNRAGSNVQADYKGIYFTDSADFADRFSHEQIPSSYSMFITTLGEKGQIYESYLNITNPLDLNNLTDEKIEELYNYIDDQWLKIDSKEQLINSLKTAAKYNNAQLIKFDLDLSKVQKAGYDGVIANLGERDDAGNLKKDNEYIVFEPNQIKNIDNLNPTENEDIRYSKSNPSWQQFLDNTYGKWNTGTRTNFEQLPSNEELQQAERESIENEPIAMFSLSEEQQNEVNDYISKLNNDTTIDDNFKDQILTRFDNLTDYKQFENIKQDVEDYKEKAYQGIKSLVDVANMKPEDVKQRPMEYTQRKDKNTSNQRRFFDNMETSNIIADEAKNRVNATTYEQKANLDTLEQVRQKLDERGNDMIEEWKHKTKNFTDKDVALGAILIERYQQAGDWNSAARAIEKLADMGTEAGRAVQMYSIFQRLSPETMALYQQKALDKAFEEMKQRKTGKWVEANKDKYKLTAEDTQFIYEQVEKAAQAIDEETKQRELSRIENRINDKLPPEDGQTIKALRRIAMLFNPKTQVRNIVGNTLIMPVNDIADVIGAGIDRIVARKTGTRTTGLPNPITKAKGFAKGVKSAVTDYKTGTRTTGSGSKYEFDIGAKPFNENTDSKVKNAINNKLNGINNLLSAVMSGGDRPFYEAAYKNSLESQMKANKVKEPTQDMIDIAVNEALQRTWNDNNEYTKAVLGIRSAMNKINIKGFGLGDLIVPFAKTPANLTKAMVEYSPAGFIPAISNYVDMSRAISRGEMAPQQQKKFVSSMSKAIAGSILYAIAGSLVKAGKITGSADDDKDVKNFEQNVLGIQPYSVRLGDKTYTYSWANPINAPLAIMADTYKMSKENASLYDTLFNAVKVAGNVLLDNSFLQGISDIFTHQEGPVAGIIESIMSMPESMIPTFLSQIASLGDDTQRQTYEYKNKGQSVINRVKNKIPGARNTLEPKVNTFGEEIENQNNLFNAFLNPANVREARTTEAQKEIYSLYEATGDKTIFPMQAPNSVKKNGENTNLTNAQKNRYQKGSGQYATEVYEPLFKSDYYDSISNDKKVELLSTVSQDANKMGKTEVGVWTEDTFKVDERYNELEDRGIPLADYYIAWSAQKDVVSDKDANGKTIKYSESNNKKEAIDKAVKGLNKKQMEYLYGIFDISEKVW